jgi:hypothetical protein
MRIVPFMALAVGALLLGACGGGGDAGGDGGGSSALAPTAAITSGNQVSIASAVIDGGVAVSGLQPLAGEDRASAQSVRAVPQVTRVGALDALVRRALSLADRRAIAGAKRPSATTSQTEACAVSGSVGITKNDVDSTGLSAGDSLTISFNECRDSSTGVLSGTVMVTFGNVSSTSEREEVAATLQFRQVMFTAGDDSIGVNGSMSIAAVYTPSRENLAMTVGSGGLVVTSSLAGETRILTYDPGMRIAVERNVTLGSSALTLSGTLSATSIGGRVGVATLAPITQPGSDSQPATGQLQVTGASGSQLRITVLDSTRIRLEVDAAGDGVYETATIVAWAAAQPL